MRDENAYPFPNFNGVAVEVWEWISNFIPHFTRVITYPYWVLSQSMLIKKTIDAHAAEVTINGPPKWS